ncbi:hypothetical protein ACQJBY_031232 [Aegilops geniculata]
MPPVALGEFPPACVSGCTVLVAGAVHGDEALPVSASSSRSSTSADALRRPFPRSLTGAAPPACSSSGPPPTTGPVASRSAPATRAVAPGRATTVQHAAVGGQLLPSVWAAPLRCAGASPHLPGHFCAGELWCHSHGYIPGRPYFRRVVLSGKKNKGRRKPTASASPPPHPAARRRRFPAPRPPSMSPLPPVLPSLCPMQKRKLHLSGDVATYCTCAIMCVQVASCYVHRQLF